MSSIKRDADGRVIRKDGQVCTSCCGDDPEPECPVYGGCEDPGWGAGSVARTIARATYLRRDDFNFPFDNPPDGIVGSCVWGPSTVLASSQAPLGECGFDTVFVGSGSSGGGLSFGWITVPLTSSSGNVACGGPITDIPIAIGGSVAINAAGQIIASGGPGGSESRVSVAFSGETYDIQFPATSDSWSVGNVQASMTVEWIESGAIRGARVAFEWEVVDNLSPPENEAGLAVFVRVDFFVYGIAWNESSDPIEVCDPEFTPPEFVPPEWFDEPDPADCPNGCEPGPLWFPQRLIPGQEPNLPDQAEWEARGGTWGCGQLVFVPCPNGDTVIRFVPCGYPIELLSPGDLCADPGTPIACPDGCLLAPQGAVLLDGAFVSPCYYLWVLENIDNPGEPTPLPEGCEQTPPLACMVDEIRTHVCNTASGPIEIRYRVPCGFLGETPQWVLDLCSDIQNEIGIG